MGYWKSITATEGIEYVYHVGIAHNTSVSDGNSAMASMTADMEAGMEFGLFGNGAHVNLGLSATVEGEITHDTSQDM